MLKLLPVVLVLVAIAGGLIYFRFHGSSSNVISPQSQTEAPIEVPKTLPQASLEDRVKDLENLVTKLVTTVNSLKSSTTSSNSDSKLNTMDASITELKARVSALEKGSPAPLVSSGKSTVYIPLGSGGQVSDQNWTSLNTFQISLDPSQYSGYTSMQLEVNMRLNQPGGTLYARLYNTTASSATSSEAQTTQTSSTVPSSSTFALPSGSKNYVLQAKTSDGSLGFLDYARIKVNF